MDRVDVATRSRIMRAIKSRNTGPERRVRRALRALGMRPRVGRGLPGTPDVTLTLLRDLDPRPRRLAVFIHGCFWHLCRRHYRAPASAGWRRKMDANRRRDIRVRRQLRRLGWATMVVWEHEDAGRAAARVARRLR